MEFDIAWVQSFRSADRLSLLVSARGRSGEPMQVGDVVADFELLDETGVPRRLTDLLAAGPVVLFFYPAAMTAGCTKESCHFRDLRSEFAAVGAQRVGISADPVDKQREFSEKHSFDFPLLSDPDRAVAESLGVKRMLRVVGPSRRTTFVIDTDRSVLAVLDSQTNMNAHADRALEVLRGRSTTT